MGKDKLLPSLMKTMWKFCLSMLVLALFTPAVLGADDGDGGGKKQNRNDKTEKKDGPKLIDLRKEIQALSAALELVKTVSDEKSAKDVAKKLQQMFVSLPVPMGGTDKQLEELARAQNGVNRQMEKMKKEPWFEPSGMQKAWTLITVPATRRAAVLKKH